MASHYPKSSIAIASTSFVLLLFISLPSKALSQDTPITPKPTVADCTPRLLQLTPCAPFVQGMSLSPSPSCCNNLKQLYLQQPACLCILLNNTNLGSFPINTTLALQLPALCDIQVDNSACSGLPQVPASSPTSQVSLGRHTNSTVAASPVIQVAPRPIIMGLGHDRNADIKLKAEGFLVLLVTLAAILLLTKAIHSV